MSIPPTWTAFFKFWYNRFCVKADETNVKARFFNVEQRDQIVAHAFLAVYRGKMKFVSGKSNVKKGKSTISNELIKNSLNETNRSLNDRYRKLNKSTF